MLIRDWKFEDNKKIAQLEKVCFEFPWSYDMVCETTQVDNFCGMVAEQNGEVIGYAGAIYCLDQADIALVATDPAFRRKGVAQTVINRLIEALLQKGVTVVYLEVRVSNDGAKALYEKLGFIAVGKRKNYYKNSEDAIVMAKVIKFD